jgi:hypothetical protein
MAGLAKGTSIFTAKGAKLNAKGREGKTKIEIRSWKNFGRSFIEGRGRLGRLMTVGFTVKGAKVKREGREGEQGSRVADFLTTESTEATEGRRRRGAIGSSAVQKEP